MRKVPRRGCSWTHVQSFFLHDRLRAFKNRRAREDCRASCDQPIARSIISPNGPDDRISTRRYEKTFAGIMRFAYGAARSSQSYPEPSICGLPAGGAPMCLPARGEVHQR